jgi:hypothetical protein
VREVVKFHEVNESYQYCEGLTINGYKPRLVNHDFRVSHESLIAAVLDMFAPSMVTTLEHILEEMTLALSRW